MIQVPVPALARTNNPIPHTHTHTLIYNPSVHRIRTDEVKNAFETSQTIQNQLFLDINVGSYDDVVLGNKLKQSMPIKDVPMEQGSTYACRGTGSNVGRIPFDFVHLNDSVR